ncbi:MAG: bifunctional riboflavin kinase/FAD synthetase [Chitinophagaceae bacterium]|nr:bifunctional riboflavin kinase/FAD synthetase [Chitinophagaceae bacterium]
MGAFDGVHSGHKHILNQLKSEAGITGGETVIITFHPHPRKIIGHAHHIRLLNTLEEKIELLSNEGIDHLVVVPFNESFAALSAEDYIKDFLVQRIHPHTIIIGYDHRFGKGRTGDYVMLEQYAGIYGFAVKEIPGKVLNEITVSSTGIRQALQDGDIKTANTLLGYDYFFEGKVIEGNQLGRRLGYPTANLAIENQEKLIPGNGIYAVEVAVEELQYKGMMSIGFNPTVDGTRLSVEVNIFNFDRNIYHKTIRVYVKHFLRAEEKFSGLDELKAQLARDKEETTRLLY